MAVSKASSKVMRSRMERRVLWGMLLLRDRALAWLLQGGRAVNYGAANMDYPATIKVAGDHPPGLLRGFSRIIGEPERGR